MKLNRLLTVGLILAGLTLYVACRKTDRQIDRPAGFKENEKFFSNHRTADPTEAALVDFIRRKNEKAPFIDKVIRQIGYPYWDKTLSFNKPINANGGRGNTGDSASIYYIPFVRDSQNYVNASLTIKIQQGDTTMRYACDWQYQNRVHGSPNVDTTAEKFALFFMMLDNRTFGYTEFDITDNSLFPESVPGPNGRRKLGLINISGSNAVRNNLIVYNEICMDFFLCGDPQGLYTCYNQCDYLNCAAAIGQPYHCYYYGYVCEGWWEETGGGGGTGTGTSGTGTGGTSGGSGGTGSTTPPPCPTGTVTLDDVTDPCEPGWNPTGGTGTGGLPPTPEPIDSMLAKYSRNINSTADSIFALSMSNNYEEWGFPFVQKNGLVYPKRCTTIHNTQMVILDRYRDVGETIIGELHTHPDPSPNPLNRSAPSGDDLETFNINSRLNYTVFVECGNVRYALVIENVSLARTFLGNNPTDLLSYNQTVIAQQQPNWQSNWQNATQVALAQLIGSSLSSGIGFYKSDATKTNYTKIN